MITLTHQGRDKMDYILQTTFVNSFSSMKMLEFWSKSIIHDSFRQWFGVAQAPGHYLNQWRLSLQTHICVTHICFGNLCQHRCRYWLVVCSVPNHYLNQCWIIAKNNLQRNFNQHTRLFLHTIFVKISTAKLWSFFLGLNDNSKYPIDAGNERMLVVL